ncbi:MAG TPA: TMEM175 family protein [Vicinamibacterales bacterium]
MTKTRLEAFSDAVIAIVITIMVLEFQAPEGADWRALNSLTPVFLAYTLSFFYLATYWNNHHHLLHATQQVSGAVLWANMHLLFWLSLIPFATAWTGEHYLEPLPTAVYGAILLLSAIAYWILVHTIMACDGPQSRVRAAVGSDAKGKISILVYAAAIPLAYVSPWIADAMYLAVALTWLVPDRRIERTLGLKRVS